MLDPAPVWTFTSRKPLTQWYGHVHLLPETVVGQWFCIERESGRLRWQRTHFRPNTLEGVDSGVIVASEMRSDGPWTATFGCYGISAETGGLLWTSHGNGLRGVLTRLLDFVPGFTNELRDTPGSVRNGEVYCESGRVLDVKTGRQKRKIDLTTAKLPEAPASLGKQFFESGIERDHPKVSLGNGITLRHAQDEGGMQRGTFIIAAETEAGEPVWRFDIRQLGRQIDSNYYSYRLMPPYLYLVVSDECRFRPHPTEPHYILPNPTLWHFVTLDLAKGQVVQDFPLGDEKQVECRIEAVDETGMLIGKSNSGLVYYRRRV